MLAWVSRRRAADESHTQPQSCAEALPARRHCGGCAERGGLAGAGPRVRPAQTPALSPQVCEPQDSWRRSRRRWSVSIDERRRLAVLLGRSEKPGVAGAPPSCGVRGSAGAPGPAPPLRARPRP